MRGMELKLPPEEFLYELLKKKFGVSAAMSEFAYNIVDACQRYSYDSDCEVFLAVVMGELCEDAHVDQQKEVSEFQQACVRMDRKINKTKKLMKGVLSRAVFFELIDAHYPFKSEDQTQALRQAVMFDQPLPVVNYTLLFDENDQGDQGKFAETLRDQHVHEIVSVHDSIGEGMKALWQKQQMKTSTDTMQDEIKEDMVLSVKQIKEVLELHDPGLIQEKAEITRILACGLGLTPEDAPFSDFRRVAVNQFMHRIRFNLIIRRFSRPPKEAEHLRAAQAIRSLDVDERRMLEECFAEIDTDYSNTLSKLEISDLFRTIFGLFQPTQSADDTVSKMIHTDESILDESIDMSPVKAAEQKEQNEQANASDSNARETEEASDGKQDGYVVDVANAAEIVGDAVLWRNKAENAMLKEDDVDMQNSSSDDDDFAIPTTSIDDNILTSKAFFKYFDIGKYFTKPRQTR